MSIPYPRRGLWRWLFKTPVWLYRLHLGGGLGRRFLLLEHRGRKSGRRYRTVIEVVKDDPTQEAYYVVSAFGERSDWFRNIRAHPHVTITVGTRRTPARSLVLSPEAGAQILMDFARRHPKEVEILTRMLGVSTPRNEEEMREFVQDYPVVKFEVEKGNE